MPSIGYSMLYGSVITFANNLRIDMPEGIGLPMPEDQGGNTC